MEFADISSILSVRPGTV